MRRIAQHILSNLFRILFYTFFCIESTQKFKDVIHQIGGGTPEIRFF